jgi:hypothetical protein
MAHVWKKFIHRPKWEFGFRHPDTLEIHHAQPRQKRAIDALIHNEAEWLFYGGAAGGGKTAWLAYMVVRFCLMFPRVQAAIFRRTHKDLERSVMLEFLNIIPPGMAVFNSDLMRFDFFNGSMLWLCYCHNESDVYQHQSAQYACLAIDEASHFTEFIVRYLITRMRSPRSGVPKWLLLGSNPGGVGHGWLKRWFIRPTAEELGNRPTPRPEEAWRPLVPKWMEGKVKPEEMPRRIFIPAKFADNFVLQAVQPEYLANLYQLGGDKGVQLAEGDWDANESMIVGRLWRESHTVLPTDAALLGAGLQVGQTVPWHVIPDPTWTPPVEAPGFGSVDYGFGAPWSFHLHAGILEHTRTWLERYGPGHRDIEQAEMVRQAIEDTRTKLKSPYWRPDWIVMDPSMWSSRKEQGLAKSIAEVYEDVLRPIGVPLIPGAAGRGARLSRPNRWMDALLPAADGFPFWSCTTGCPDLIRTVPDVPWDEEDPDVEDDESENHCLAPGTLIATTRGDVPIERVQVGDLVLTRQGYRRVVRSWQSSPDSETVEIACSNGRVLRGAGHHPVWVEGRGFVPLIALASGDILVDVEENERCRKRQSWCPRPFKSGAGAASTVAGRISCKGTMAGFIAWCGRIFTGRFLPAITSIIGTGTATTITPTTSNSSRVGLTWSATGNDPTNASELPGGATRRWQPLLAWRFLSSRRRAANAAHRFGRMCETESSAPRAVGRAPLSVVESVRASAPSPVYDLSVEDVHEFYANGILVSNCYEDVGRFFEARPHTLRRPPVDPLAHLAADPLSHAHQAARERRYQQGRVQRLDVRGLGVS